MIDRALSEADILNDFLVADEGDLSAVVAKSVLKWKFSRSATSRMNRLAERNRQGKITAEERVELERFLRIGSFLNLLHAKAKLSLADHAGSKS